MRKVVSALFISVDGVTESPDKWQFEFDDDMGAEMTRVLATLDAALMGRVTFEEWASYWPTAEDEYGNFINPVAKYVASTTLDSVDGYGWQNSTLLKGNLDDALADLKQQPGKDIGVQDSPTLVRYLLQNDLLDRLMLLIHPVVAGNGKRLFEGWNDLKRLQLVDTKTTSSGVVILTYEPFVVSDEA